MIEGEERWPVDLGEVLREKWDGRERSGWSVCVECVGLGLTARECGIYAYSTNFYGGGYYTPLLNISFY